MRAKKTWKVWAIFKRNGKLDGVSLCATLAGAANDLSAKYGEKLEPATLTLAPKPRRKK